ncbi:MAG: hypothetical protein M3R67_08610 [Acidobacteriota bacterium]|nr:hypothetical protein [Acidobacteriota bacterium]
MNSFGQFFQRAAIGIDAYKQALGILAGTAVGKQTIPGPNVNRDSIVVRTNEFREGCSIYLSKGLTANES